MSGRIELDPGIESQVIAELYQDQESICWAHHLSLRPALIRLMDSETHWGKWDPITRTIWVARKLVASYSWFHVVSILRHEMAHQWVDEMAPFHGYVPAGAPHGELFQRACRMLGVPAEFSQASSDLQSISPDWRERPRDAETDRLMDKVRKLLALGTSSNEHEALLAMNKVRELHARYNLSQSRVAPRTDRHAHRVIEVGKRRMEAHHNKIAGILVGHFFVRVIHHRDFNVHAGERRPTLEIIGTRENVLMAEYVYHFLIRETEVLLDGIVQSRGGKLSRVERKSARLGILQGFSDKLQAAERERPPSVPGMASSSRGTSLSVIGQAIQEAGRDDALDHYISGVYPRLGTRSGSRSLIDERSFSAGRQAGKGITLHRPVTDSDGNRGRLLDHKAR